MRFSNTKQVLSLTLAWSAALVGLDYTTNRHLWRSADPAPPAVSGVHLRLWINHLCCTGCLADLQAALAELSWGGPPAVVRGGDVLPHEQADAARRPLGEFGNRVDLQVPDLSRVDFVALDRALRAKGLVAGRMEIGGLPHFRLEAELPHLCCGMCERGAQTGLDFAKAYRSTGGFKWLDSVTVDRARKRIVAHARFLDEGKTVDVAEFLAGLDYVGLAPRSVRVLTEEARP